jgi:hypothetical protein
MENSFPPGKIIATTCCSAQSFGYALTVVTPIMMMPPPVRPVIPIGISGVSDGMSHKDRSRDGTDNDGGDHQAIGAARCWGRNRASRDDRRPTKS